MPNACGKYNNEEYNEVFVKSIKMTSSLFNAMNRCCQINFGDILCYKDPKERNQIQKRIYPGFWE